MKSLLLKKPSKSEREIQVLLGLMELYLKEGKPIGSNTLQANGFGHLSSATIRNYFAKLEEEGYLSQQHSSGGRIPTNKAFKLYVETYLSDREDLPKEERLLEKALFKETKEVVSYLHAAAQTLSELTHCPVFVSTPKFDADFIQTIRLIPLDSEKLLCILVTDFGFIRTETLFLPKAFTLEETNQLEEYFYWRLSKKPKAELSDDRLLKWAQRIYNEIIVRHVTNSSSPADIYRTGLSKLLLYPEFSDPASLSCGLSFFENPSHMQRFLHECSIKNTLCCWVGEEKDCSVLAIPYRIGGTSVGSFALLGPCRIPYRKLFSTLDLFSTLVSEALTNSIHKFAIHFHPPQEERGEKKNLSKAQLILLEDKSKNPTRNIS